MKETFTYKGKRIRIETKRKLRKGKCKLCGREGRTELHHWKYDYPVKDVRKEPWLGLKNTSELCFQCHQKANAFRIFLDTDEKTTARLLILKNDAIE